MNVGVVVKCRRCGADINRDTEEFVKISSGYAHKSCEEQFQIKRNTVICQICRQNINKLSDEYLKKSTGYIHRSCVPPEEADRLELCNYIVEIFHLKAPGPANMRLIKKFHTENGYSYKSMYYTLKYYFEIKKGSIEKSQERIGILPYVYDEAKQYYENLTRTQNLILRNVEKQLVKEEKVIVVKQNPAHKGKKVINLEDLD